MKPTNFKTVMGPLWKVYSDPAISEICIDSFDEVYWETKGEIKTDKKIFKTKEDLNRFIVRVMKAGGVSLKGKSAIKFSIEESNSVNIVLPPIAMKGPAVNIIKMVNQNFTLQDLVNWKALEEDGKKYLEDIIANHKGLLIAGAPGSGKTTLLNIMINAIPQPQRVVTIEPNAELVIYREKVCRLRTVSGEPEEVLNLVKYAGNMRADWLVISNLSGMEVMPYMELLRSNGSGLGLTTGQDVFDAIKRLETKALLSSQGQSLEDVRYAISQAFPYICFQERRGKKRVVSAIGEIQYDAGQLKIKIVHKL